MIKNTDAKLHSVFVKYMFSYFVMPPALVSSALSLLPVETTIEVNEELSILESCLYDVCLRKSIWN